MIRRREKSSDRREWPILSDPTLVSSATGSDESVIFADDVFEGHYRFAGGVCVQGSIEGSIEARGSVRIEPQGRVIGEIAAANITVAGEHRGSSKCRGTLLVKNGGRVIGEIRTNTLVIEEGACIEGEVRMRERVLA
jgi:cytoskeletal protein CcmA (bactofilin family)